MRTTRRIAVAATIATLLAALVAPSAAAQSAAPRYDVTQGTSGSTPMRTNSPIVAVDNHGTRIYCTTSHLSYDDPVVFPGQPGRAHLHTFWGNTETNYASTGDSLLSSGNSSCEGGTNNRSSYWAPALFDQFDQAVIPESIFVYYKTFGGPDFDRTTIQPIPNGLEMLATTNVDGAWFGDFRTEAVDDDGRAQLKATIQFPVCIAVDASGSPILSSPNNTDHLAYGSPGDGDGTDCADTHPYRIPQVSYHITYDVDPYSDWYLASDTSAATQGDSLHADYIAAWDTESMDRLIQCNIESRSHCEFGRFDGDRNQLRSRFLSPDGTRLYASSVELRPGTDRTPFGTELTKNLEDGGGHDHGDHDHDDDEAISITLTSFDEGTDGWVLYEHGPDAGTQQWVSRSCAAQLTQAGVSFTPLDDYVAEIGSRPTVDTWRDCAFLLNLVN